MAEKETKDNKPDKAENWKFTQWFRKMRNAANRTEDDDFDHLTAVEFDDTGRFLATGDKSGNIVVLESDDSKSKSHSVHYSFFGEFTSHYADFDFVKSDPIQEKIKKIKFGPSNLESIFLLTTNDKKIKLWKLQEKEQYKLMNWNIEPVAINFLPGYTPIDTARSQPIIKNLRVPKKVITEKAKIPTLRKTYAADVHAYNIESLSVTADKETFISGDNLRINLWDMNICTHAYNVLDVKPDDMNELSEIISSADCHPTQSNLFLYSTSLGNIMTCDLRQRALVDEPCQVFSETTEDAGFVNTTDEEREHQTFFNEMTQNVTDAKYSTGGKFIFSRDYMSVKIWDITMERAPVETIYVHEYLRERMWDLYSNELFWDLFGLGISSKGNIVTGSYSNYFHVFDLAKGTDTFIHAAPPSIKTTDLARSKKMKNVVPQMPEAADENRDNGGAPKKKTKYGLGLFKNKKKKGSSEISVKPQDDYPHNIPFEQIEFNKKILDCAWHPEKDAIAVAGQDNLYIYAKAKR